MKTLIRSRLFRLGSVCRAAAALAVCCLVGTGNRAQAVPAPLLFSDDFSLPGWTAVQPAYNLYQGVFPTWGYDASVDALFENSNLYSDSAANAPQRITSMLINDTVPPVSGYELKARMTTTDDDGAGLIFGYENSTNFYRFEVSRQNSASRTVDWPWLGWSVDRMENNNPIDLFGVGSPNPPIEGWNAWTNTTAAFDVVLAVTNNRLWLTITNQPTTTIVATVANARGTNIDGTGYAANDNVAINVYAYRIVNNRRIYSATATPASLVTSNDTFDVNWAWNPTASTTTTGYRLMRSTNGGAFDYYTDIELGQTGTNFFDNNTSWTNGTPEMVSKEFYFLVTNGLLPSIASGRVGLMSWGMESAPNAYGVRWNNRTLSPTPLAGSLTPPNIWTNAITAGPGAAIAWDATLPRWYRCLGPTLTPGLTTNGVYFDYSDPGIDNTAANNVNFRSSATVSGNPNWTNYMFSARVLSTDDDGFGFFLRYLNRTNFYRVAFRRQNSASGVLTGVTMQQSVSNVFTEITNSTGLPRNSWVYPQNLPIEINCMIKTQSIWLQLVSDPDGARVATNLGPYNVYGTTIPNGKIGMFGWYQLYTFWDDVKVHNVSTGEVLKVVSAYGNPTPDVGVHEYPTGSTVSGATAPASFVDGEGKLHVCTGWKATGGSIPAVGTSNTVPDFVMSSGITRLEWTWGVLFNLTVSATPGGTANFIGSTSVVEGSVTNLVATNFPGYMFVGWSGLPSATTVTNLSLTMTRAYTVVANFAPDADNDGLPDTWETTYFGNLSQGPNGDPDGDGKTNLQEYQLGTNPNAPETLVATDGMTTRWFNPSRDRGIPGWYKVADLGLGFRGLYEDSDQYRYANAVGISGAGFWTASTYASNASFQGTAIILKTNDYNPDYSTNFIFTSDFSAGDNDGINVYFRYRDEYNYYRFTLCGQAADADNIRPVIGPSIQMRSNGVFYAITPLTDTGATSYYMDPTDTVWYKRSRITIAGTNDTFEIKMTGWQGGDFFGVERVLTFVNSVHTNGAMGVGTWAMGNFGSANNTGDNPVTRGAFIDNLAITNNGVQVFAEDWETVTLSTNLLAGWTNAFVDDPALRGDWQLTAHGTIGQLADGTAGTAQSGISGAPKADTDGPMLIAPPLTNLNYSLEIGILPYDDGGMGFVYDYVDTNNYSRVMFNNRAVAVGVMTPGLNISRKSAGVWTDIVVGDTNFVYTPGAPFDLRFGNNSGVYTLTAANSAAPNTVYKWRWTNAVSVSPQYGLGVWRMPDAHYTYVRAYGIAAPVVPLQITSVLRSGNNVVLNIQNSGANYVVLRSSDITLPLASWTRMTTNNAAQYVEPLSGANAYFYSLEQAP